MNKLKKKLTIVKEHPRKVRVSLKNPDGVTTVDRHPRRIAGSYLNPQEIAKIYESYNRKTIKFPGSHRLGYRDGNKYDELIAVWTDYFNKKFRFKPPLDPDVIKALIASESGFKADTPSNKIAFGIMQITDETFRVLLDSKGESKDFIFQGVRKKDLKNPSINIPMGIRWLSYKKIRAEKKLSRSPTNEEIILEYKGLLKSRTTYKVSALDNYRKHYELLKSND